MYCPHCGSAVGEESQFCPECGGRLKNIGDTQIVPEEDLANLMTPEAEELEKVEESAEPASEPQRPANDLVPDLSEMTETLADQTLVCSSVEGHKNTNSAIKWVVIAAVTVSVMCACCFLSFIMLGTIGSN